MKSNSEDIPLLPATKQILVNLHPNMCLPCADVVAMTTTTIDEMRNKGLFQKQLSLSGLVNFFLISFFFGGGYFILLLLF